MKKQISEEINSMKFLLNYKRGIVISEQAVMGTIPDTISDEPTIKVNPPIQDTKNTPTDWSKYPCVVKHPKAKKGKTVKGIEFYQIGNYYYYNNGRKWNIVMNIAQNYTCNDPEFKVKNTVKQTIKIPSELKDGNGVKLFQDWLDINHAGWATGFPNGKLNKGAGYGKFGPRTQKAWALYGKEYLQSLTTPTEVEGDSAWMKSQKEKIRSEKPNPALTAPIQKVGTPLQSAQNPTPTVNQGLSQLKPQ